MIYLVSIGNDVAVSSINPDHPDWENNHVIVTDSHTCGRKPEHRLPGHTLANILRNALTATDEHKVTVE